MSELPRLPTCECFPTLIATFNEYHGMDECPTTSKPCPCTNEDCIASCANLTIDHTLYSEEFDDWLLLVGDPIADVSIYFDDLGSVTGRTETLSCDNTSQGCVSCSINDTLEPFVETRPNNKARFKLLIHGQNAYWGGPYGINAYVSFTFTPKKNS
jgi:hypothetical protein